MTKQLTAVLLSAVLAAGGCASASGPRVAADPQPPAIDRAVMGEYVQRIPAGSKVRVDRTGGPSIRGTMMKATTDAIVVQRDTRVPEPPVEIPIATITRLTLDQGGSSTGRNVAIGIVSGVGATFGVLLILAAIWAD